jgi:hypothetical protein
VTTAERRLAKVESGLSPTALVVRWLEEAHAYDDFTAYTGSLLDADPSTFPIDRLVHEAKASAGQQVRGLARNEADTAIDRAIVAVVFRFLLVLRINVMAQEFLDREGLIQGFLAAHIALALVSGEEPSPGRATLPLVQIRDLLFRRVTELHAMQSAREAAEVRYLDGHPALFPSGQRAWATQRHESEREAVIAMRLAEFDDADPPPDDDQSALDARVAQLIADHVEPARSRAYDELGDGRRAMALAVRWLRPKLVSEYPVIGAT